MDQIVKPFWRLETSRLLAVSILMIANVSIAQATIASYGVTGVFTEPATAIGHTTFTGTFNWDADTEIVSDLQGSINETMHDPVDFPDQHLGFQLYQSVVGNIVTASVFSKNTTDVFQNGGFTKGDSLKYGFGDGNTTNENAYFTFAFDKTTMVGIVDSMVYGDCSPGGLMGGALCMTGHDLKGTMQATPSSLTLSAVPVPAAVWLFGSALAGLIGVSRKRV